MSWRARGKAWVRRSCTTQTRSTQNASRQSWQVAYQPPLLCVLPFLTPAGALPFSINVVRNWIKVFYNTVLGKTYKRYSGMAVRYLSFCKEKLAPLNQHFPAQRDCTAGFKTLPDAGRH